MESWKHYALWASLFAFLTLILVVDVTVTLLTVHPNSCDIRLARLNTTDLCASHCATLFIRRG